MLNMRKNVKVLYEMIIWIRALYEWNEVSVLADRKLYCFFERGYYSGGSVLDVYMKSHGIVKSDFYFFLCQEEVEVGVNISLFIVG